MTMRFWVDTLRVKTKVLRQRVHERSLLGLHWLEAKSLLAFLGCKDAELAFLCLTPLGVLRKEVERLGRVRYVVASFDMCRLINIEGKS